MKIAVVEDEKVHAAVLGGSPALSDQTCGPGEDRILHGTGFHTFPGTGKTGGDFDGGQGTGGQ